MRIRFSLFFALLCLMILSSVAKTQSGKWIRVSLIEASPAGPLYIDKKINFLEKHLKEAIENSAPKEPGDPKGFFQIFRHFSALLVSEPLPVTIGKPILIPLNSEKNQFFEITIHELEEEFYPTDVRWYLLERDQQTDIVKSTQKFFKGRCLFIGKSSRKVENAQLIAVEFVNSPEKNGEK